MDDRTRAATYDDLFAVVGLLETEHVEYALVGGYALALQGIVRLTEDIDILVEPTLVNAERWVRALSQLPDGAARELEGDATLHTEPYAIRINDEFTVDVMNSASGLGAVPFVTRRFAGISVSPRRFGSHGTFSGSAAGGRWCKSWDDGGGYACTRARRLAFVPAGSSGEAQVRSG